MNDLAKTLEKIQEEMRPWQAHNFPDRGRHCPILGLVEELGELETATKRFDREEVIDALCDTLIFATDACSAISTEEIAVNVSDLTMQTMVPRGNAMQIAGRLCHCFLKAEQGIRGRNRTDVCVSISEIIEYVQWVASLYDIDLEKEVTRTWEKVRLRDFKKNAVMG